MKNMTEIECLMLTRCRKASGINCNGRNFEECEFFKNLIKDANKTILTKAELKRGLIILHCYKCNMIRKFKKTLDVQSKLNPRKMYECLTCQTRVKFPRKEDWVQSKKPSVSMK